VPTRPAGCSETRDTPSRLTHTPSHAASLRMDNCPQSKEAQPLPHALTSDQYNCLTPRLMVRSGRRLSSGSFLVHSSPLLNNTVRSGRITREALQQQSRAHKELTSESRKAETKNAARDESSRCKTHTHTNAHTLTRQHGSRRCAFGCWSWAACGGGSWTTSGRSASTTSSPGGCTTATRMWTCPGARCRRSCSAGWWRNARTTSRWVA
jgi:hypothetical protein